MPSWSELPSSKLISLDASVKYAYLFAFVLNFKLSGAFGLSNFIRCAYSNGAFETNTVSTVSYTHLTLPTKA